MSNKVSAHNTLGVGCVCMWKNAFQKLLSILESKKWWYLFQAITEVTRIQHEKSVCVHASLTKKYHKENPHIFS